VGLISSIVLLPLAPVRGVAWMADYLATEAERQLTDDVSIREQLASLAAAHDRGELTDDEYDAVEDRLLRLMQQTVQPLDSKGNR